MSEPSPPQRSVKIDPDERGGWSSERPRKPGESERPPRQANVSVRNRVLAPTDRMRYSPGSLLLVIGPDAAALDAFTSRAVDEKGAVLTLTKLRGMLEGRVPADQVDAKAVELREAAARKRLQAGDSVVIATPGLDPEEREHWVRIAHGFRRPRHLLLIESGTDALDEDAKAELNALRKALDSAALGEEGFATATRLSGRAIDERRKVIFAPPPQDN